MRIGIIGMVIGIVLALTTRSAFAQTPEAAPASCDDVVAYYVAIIDSVPEDSAVMQWFEDDADIETMRPSEMAALSESLDAWATVLEDMPEADIPDVAMDFHRAFIDFLSVLSSMLHAMNAGGPFAAMAYTEQMDAATVAMDEAKAGLNVTCNI